jgi:SET family sugar efflux transporter-like MFS transporter
MNSWWSFTGRLLRQRGIVGFLASTFSLGIGYAFVLPFLSLWGTEAVGFSAFQFGLFMTATSLSGIVVSTVLARLSDTRLSRRTLLMLGSGSGALAYTGYGLLRDPFALVAIGLTANALSTVCFAQLFATARDWFTREPALRRDIGVTLSVVRVCFSFAWTAGPALGAVIKAHFDFTGLFLGAATCYVLFLLGAWRWVPPELRPAPGGAAAQLSVWRTLRRPDLLGYFACWVLLFAAFTMNMMNLPLAVTRELGGTARDLGIIFGVGPVVEVPLMLWFGHLASRGQQVLLLRIGMAVTVLYFVLLLFAREPWHVYFIQSLSGVAFAIIANVAIGFFQDLLPGQVGLATTVFGNATQLGNLVGYLGFGALASALGPRGLFAVGAIAGAIALVLFLVVHRLARHRDGEPRDRPAST